MIRDSTALGWSGAYAALTSESNFDIDRPSVDAIWLAVAEGPTHLRRFMRRGEYSGEAIPRQRITITPPNEAVRDVLTAAGRASRVAGLHVFVSPDIVREVAEEIGRGRADMIEIGPALGLEDATLMRILQGLKHALNHPHCGARLKAEHLTMALAAHLVQAHAVDGRGDANSAPCPPLAPRQVQLLEDYIQENLANEISNTELAAVLGISRAHFLRRFKQATGTSPYQRVMQLRVERAKNLLSATRFNLSEVASASGFASQTHLSHVFTRHVGVCPSVFRRQTAL